VPEGTVAISVGMSGMLWTIDRSSMSKVICDEGAWCYGMKYEVRG